MALKEYKKKRHFGRTPEPQGIGPITPGRRFVVQKHAARRLHYDFRLELDGVLKSWAVPKGPSLDPEVKSLAVHVEDHPIEYATFEGVIPKDQYGGGTVMVWDHGTWEPEGDAKKALRKGRLKFKLFGDKLSGSWALVQMKGAASEDGNDWLLIKHRDEAARPSGARDILARQPRSVISDRDMQQIAADADRTWQSDGKAARDKDPAKKAPVAKKGRAKAKQRISPVPPKEVAKLTKARSAPLPSQFKPQLAKLFSAVPPGDNWLHELKFDGYRILAFIDHGKVRLVTRNGHDWADRFPAVVAALAELPIESALLDGEIVSLDGDGRSDFQQLQNMLNRGDKSAPIYYLFDAPYLQGYGLTATPLVERKEVLARLVLSAGPSNEGVLRYSDHIQGQGKNVLAHACRYALEGVVSKQADGAYQQARVPSWRKVKCLKRQEFVIGGYTKPGGSRVGFGALLVGYYESGRLVYAGRVGTGFTHDSLGRLKKELKKRQTDKSPFAKPLTSAQRSGVTWVKPELVAEVEFLEWTGDGVMRHPSFQGLREDKPADQVIREEPDAPAEQPDPPKKGGRSARGQPGHQKAGADNTVAGIEISHPDRVLYPEQGVTKLDLAKFYESIADYILPHLVGRPLVLVRCPQGRGSNCFYQKHHTGALPEGARGVMIQEKSTRGQYVVIDDLTGLVGLVQMGVLEIHPWGARADKIEKPDRVVFDLDPGPGTTWSDVVRGARDVRQSIDERGLRSFVRTSGGKGLHVVIPLEPRKSWDAIREFAEGIAVDLVKRAPDRYVATMSKAKRPGKVFIDYFRNGRGATAVASYSTRARAGAPIAMPVRWEELAKLKSADRYNVTNAGRRLATARQDPWEGFFELRQSL